MRVHVAVIKRQMVVGLTVERAAGLRGSRNGRIGTQPDGRRDGSSVGVNDGYRGGLFVGHIGDIRGARK